MSPVLVTGGAGYIGSHTVRSLLEAGHEVVIYDNLSTGHRSTVNVLRHGWPETLQFVEGDLLDARLLQRTFERLKPSAVMHFAAHLDVAESTVNPLKYYGNNVAGTISLLQAMEAADCRCLIFSSTCATYGQPLQVPVSEDTPQTPITPYGRSKWMIEQILRDCAATWGLGSASLRYFNVAGASRDALLGERHEPEVHLIPRVFMAITGELPALGICGTDYPTPDGTCIRDYLHVDDVAAAHVLLLSRTPPGTTKSYNLGTGRGSSVRDIVAAAEAVTGLKCPIQVSERRPGDPACLFATPERLQREHGWQPVYRDLEAIIDTAWRFHRAGRKREVATS